MPEKFNVAGIDYNVVYTAIDTADDLTLFGECEYQTSKIRINTKSTKQRQEQTLIHELMHAILFEAGYSDQTELEDLVNRSSMVLYQVLKDNDFSFLRK